MVKDWGRQFVFREVWEDRLRLGVVEDKEKPREFGVRPGGVALQRCFNNLSNEVIWKASV